MVLGCLRSAPLREHAKYLGGCKRPPPPTTDRPDEVGRNIRGPTEGRPKSPGTGSEEKRMDLGGHMDTRRRESLRVPRYRKGPVPNLEVGSRNHRDLEGR